jgi:hypothetical protein
MTQSQRIIFTDADISSGARMKAGTLASGVFPFVAGAVVFCFGYSDLRAR